MGTAPSRPQPSESLSPVELLGMAGLGLGFGWLLIVTFWLFNEATGVTFTANAPLVQLFLLSGCAFGFLGLHLLCRLPRFTPFSPWILIPEAVAGATLPVLYLLQMQGAPSLDWLLCACGLATGVASSFLITSWLDVCSRLHTRMYGRFTGSSLLIGGLAFALAAALPPLVAPVFALIYLMVSIGLAAYATRAASDNATCPPMAAIRGDWHFQKEVEPSLFVFGITFGMTFSWLFIAGGDAVFIGLCSIIPGALCIALLSVLRIKVNITMMLRILLCLCVFACVFMPQSTYEGRLACSCLIVAAWAMFMSLNYAFIVRKSVVLHSVPCYREAPAHLSVPAFGIAVGWFVIYVGSLAFGQGSPDFANVRLAVAVLLVVVFALFFPSQEHHSMDSSSSNPSGLDEVETFDLKIQGIGKAYGLSPREVEVARFLARGRNAAYIQERLVVSPHTVRSHMYNIYKKMGVHSQQEVIGAVEAFPIDTEDYA